MAELSDKDVNRIATAVWEKYKMSTLASKDDPQASEYNMAWFLRNTQDHAKDAAK